MYLECNRGAVGDMLTEAPSDCRMENDKTPDGPVRVKTASGMGVEKGKAEYGGLSARADPLDVPLQTVRETAKPSI